MVLMMMTQENILLISKLWWRIVFYHDGWYIILIYQLINDDNDNDDENIDDNDVNDDTDKDDNEGDNEDDLTVGWEPDICNEVSPASLSAGSCTPNITRIYYVIYYDNILSLILMIYYNQSAMPSILELRKAF